MVITVLAGFSIGGLLGIVNWNIVFMVTMIAVPLIILIYWFATSRKPRKTGGISIGFTGKKSSASYGLLPEGSGDILVFLVDDTTRRIIPTWASRLSGSLYMLEQGGQIRYMVLLPDTKVYDLGDIKSVLAYGYSSLVLPLDPSLLSVYKLMENAEQMRDDMARMEVKDLKSLLSFLMKLEDKMKGDVVVPGYGKVAFSFDIHKIVTNSLHTLLYQPVVTIRRFFGTMEDIDRIRELIKSRIELEKARAGKFPAIGYAIFIALLGVGILMAILFSTHAIP